MSTASPILENKGSIQGAYLRASDRLNPILVRVMQQWMGKKFFLISVIATFAAVCVVALWGVSEYREGSSGYQLFQTVVILLVPISFFLVPIQAFHSMLEEMQAGVFEQLLLSNLRPSRIILGKLGASILQFTLFLSIISPLLAFAYTLRGVNFGMVFFTLSLALLTSIGCSALTIAIAGLCQWRPVQIIMQGIVSFALAITSLPMMFGAMEILRDMQSIFSEPEFWWVFACMVSGYLLAIAVLVMASSALLAHPYENRSTQFRIFVPVALLSTVAWFIFFGIRHSMSAGNILEGAAVTTAMSAGVFGLIFWLFAVTEESELSPRVRALVPKKRWLAALSIPFLPGGGRGLLFTIIFLAGPILVTAMLGVFASGRHVNRDFGIAIISTLYSFAFIGTVATIRNFAPRGARWNWICRACLPALVTLGCLVPAILDVLFTGRVGSWNFLHISNPFWTIDRCFSWSRSSMRLQVITVLAFYGGALIVVNLKDMIAGIREVLAASAERRSRAA